MLVDTFLEKAKAKLFLARHTMRENWQDWYALMDEAYMAMRDALDNAATPAQRAACNAVAADILAAYRDR